MKKELEQTEHNGKLPPQSLDLEMAVLGAIMLEKSAYGRAMSILNADMFYSDANKLIYTAIESLASSRQPIDILTVISKLRSNGDLDSIGGAYYVTSLTNNVASAANIEYHAHVIMQKYISREVIQIAGWSGKEAFDETADIFETLTEISKRLLNIHTLSKKNSDKSMDKIVSEVITDIKLAMENDDHINGIPTGNTTLDKITGGWQKGDLIVIAARPSMGKTARVLTFLKKAVDVGKSALLMSYEMSSHQLVKRLLSEASGLDLSDVNRGRLSPYSFNLISNIANEIKSLPIALNDNGRTTIYDLANRCRILKASGKLDMLIVDYLQIIPRGKQKEPRHELIGLFTSELKSLAKELDIPVIILSQLNRSNEGNTDKRPKLEHLKESGSIEQDADMVGFIYRPSYYTQGDQSKETDEEFKSMDEREYLMYSEFIIAKNRNGKLGFIKEYFEGSKQRFTECMPSGEMPYDTKGGITPQLDTTDKILPF